MICSQMQAPQVVLIPVEVESLQDLWNGFNNRRMAFLDLSKLVLQHEANISSAGPRACLVGELHLVPGQFGASSQVPLQ